MKKVLLERSRLIDVLDYYPNSGDFVWKKRLSVNTKLGMQAGTKDSKNYLQIAIDRHLYLAHRLAWLYVNSVWPKEELDHINGDRSDNRIVNLRLSSRSTNLANSRIPISNTAGLKGVWVCKGRVNKRFRAGIGVNGKSVHLGYFDTVEGAHSAYVTAAQKYFGEFARAQ